MDKLAALTKLEKLDVIGFTPLAELWPILYSMPNLSLIRASETPWNSALQDLALQPAQGSKVTIVLVPPLLTAWNEQTRRPNQDIIDNYWTPFQQAQTQKETRTQTQSQV